MRLPSVKSAKQDDSTALKQMKAKLDLTTDQLAVAEAKLLEEAEV